MCLRMRAAHRAGDVRCSPSRHSGWQRTVERPWTSQAGFPNGPLHDGCGPSGGVADREVGLELLFEVRGSSIPRRTGLLREAWAP